MLSLALAAAAALLASTPAASAAEAPTQLAQRLAPDADTVNELLQRIEQLEQMTFEDKPRFFPPDERSHLELFGETARAFLLRKLEPPPSDLECGWAWGTFTCEPHCDCRLHPVAGDYSLERACRRREPGARDAACDPDSPSPALTARALAQAAKAGGWYAQAVAPATDAACAWKWDAMQCEPRDRCALAPKPGDYSLGRACRARPAEEAAAEGGADGGGGRDEDDAAEGGADGAAGGEPWEDDDDEYCDEGDEDCEEEEDDDDDARSGGAGSSTTHSGDHDHGDTATASPADARDGAGAPDPDL